MSKGYTKSGAIDFRRLPRIIVRPLGKHGADGLAWHGLFDSDTATPCPPTIEVDSRLAGVLKLETILHEIDHLIHPAAPEHAVLRNNRYRARVLWHLGLRFEDERED